MKKYKLKPGTLSIQFYPKHLTENCDCPCHIHNCYICGQITKTEKEKEDHFYKSHPEYNR